MEPSLQHQIEIFNYTIGIGTITLRIVVMLILLCLLLILSALISGSEIGFFSLSPTELKKLKSSNNRTSNLILRLLKSSQNLLATILVGNNFVNIAIVILSTYICNKMFDFSQAVIIGFVFEVGIVTFLILLFGEIVPKIYSNQYPLRFASIMCYPLLGMSKIFAPLTFVLLKLSSSTNKPLHANEVSMEDISYALDITSEASISSEKEILENIVKLKDTDVESIMTSRVDVVAIDISKNFKDIRDKIIESGYSRIPVYKDTFDNVKGILYVKDLMPHIQKNVFRWQTLIRPPYYVPYTKKIDDLLEDFQKSKIHLAVVIDEYGGTSGIITLDDILSEIVGEFSEEEDAENIEYTQLDSNVYLFDGKILLNDFYKVIDAESEFFDEVRGDADTLAGMILEIKGDFPILHEEIRFKNYIFEIEAENKRRIQKIKVTME